MWFDFDFGVLKISRSRTRSRRVNEKNPDEKTSAVLKMSGKGLELLHVFL
jgi:hypothetical protein